MSTPVKPVTPIAAAPAPKYYDLASPSVVMDGVVEPLLAFAEYLGMVHRVVFGKQMVVTSGRDSVHVVGSLHAEGKAVDVRTKDLLPDEQALLLHLIAFAGPSNHIACFDERALGAQAHIHLEWHG